MTYKLKPGNSRGFKFSALLLSTAMLGATAFAQESAAPTGKAVILEILDVRKNDSAAKEKGGERLVPLEMRRLVKGQAGAKVIELRAVLETVNTDGRTSRVEKILPDVASEVFVSTLLLPMDKGVFAKKFTLTLIAKASLGDQVVEESASKSGNFSEPGKK